LELGAEEYFLCQNMDGRLTPSEIAAAFQDRFGMTLAEEDLQEFARQLAQRNFLQTYSEPEPEPIDAVRPHSPQVESHAHGAGLSDRYPHFFQRLRSGARPQISRIPRRTAPPPYRWHLGNPEPLLAGMATCLAPLGTFPWLGWAIAILAFFVLSHHWDTFWQDLTTTQGAVSLVAKLGLGFLWIHLLGKLAYGALCHRYGARVRACGIQWMFGFFPLFYLTVEGLHQCSRKQRLQALATPLIVRLWVLTLGILAWFSFRTTQPTLANLTLLWSQAAFIGLCLHTSPLWRSTGYLWLTSYFHLPRYLERGHQVLGLMWHRRRLPPNLSKRQQFWLQAYAIAIGLFGAIAGIWAFLWLGSVVAARFGGTGMAIFLLLAILAIRWGLTVMNGNSNPPPSGNKHRLETLPEGIDFDTDTASTSRRANRHSSATLTASGFWRRNWLKLAILGGFGILMCLPYRYRPGGSLELLPPKQKQIQADISGKIVQVWFPGGNGEWLSAGTPIAEIEPSRQIHHATPTNNDVQIALERIENQKAVLAGAQAHLNRLLNTPRPEEVSVATHKVIVEREKLNAAQSRADIIQAELELAQRQVEVEIEELNAARSRLQVARENLEGARRELETATVAFDFRNREATRLRNLHAEGVVPLQDTEDAERQAQVSQAVVEEKKQNLESRRQQVTEQQHNLQVQEKIIAEKQNSVAVQQQKLIEQQRHIRTQQQNLSVQEANLALVTSGTHPDELDIARSNVAAAKAELQRWQQQLKDTQEQLQKRALLMPFDGTLATPFLDRQLGSYLEQGETFAVAQDDRNIQGEVQIPESDIGEFQVGAAVDIKLAAYPGQVFPARVVSIEPTVVEQANGRFVKAIVEIANAEQLLRSGMTGYAKIEGSTKPAFVAFTRPLVRFVRVEVWSWIP
jgi:multidrug efflux pump subunit AcrA (membrane-fusion protein)